MHPTYGHCYGGVAVLEFIFLNPKKVSFLIFDTSSFELIVETKKPDP